MNENMSRPESDISGALRALPVETPTHDAFDAIMQRHRRAHGRHWIWGVSAAATVLLGVVLSWHISRQNGVQQDELERLMARVENIETLLAASVPRHSDPGSELLEKMVSLESWLDQIDRDIARSDDGGQKMELLHAKLDLLGDLLALQQKVKNRSTNRNQMI